MSAAGFTSAGVAAGSIAAAVQSGIGVVEAGSIFAALQSLGATRVLLTVGGPIAIATGALVGLSFYLAKKLKRRRR